MKKVSIFYSFNIIYLLLIVSITGCSKKALKVDVSKNKDIDFICEINETNILNCSNEYSVYDKNNNLISIVSNNGDSEFYNYIYDENNNVISVEKQNGKKILITYNSNGKPLNISLIVNPYEDDEKQTKYIYNFIYDSNNRLIEISMAFNYGDTIYGEFQDERHITYEYYKKDNINYVKETRINSLEKEIRIFKLENMVFSNNILQLINNFSNIYYRNLMYYPYNNLANVNYGNFDEPLLFISAIESYEHITANNGTKKINYYFDYKNRFITDSEKSIAHKYVEESKNKVVRYTIYEKTYKIASDFYKNYYEYKTEYIYDEDRLVKFIKYKENKITKSQYEKTMNEYIDGY